MAFPALILLGGWPVLRSNLLQVLGADCRACRQNEGAGGEERRE